MNNEVNRSYSYFVKLGLWNFLEILLKGNCLNNVDKSKFASYIWEVSSGSNFYRNDRSVIDKEWLQCWLAIHAFKCLYKNGDYSDFEFLSGTSLDESISLLQEELQFKSLLDNLNVSNLDVGKELSHLHTMVCHSEFVRRLLPSLSSGTIEALENSLVQQPGLTCSLINRLICLSPSFENSNLQLKNMFNDVIFSLVKKLDSANDCGETEVDLQSKLLSLLALANNKGSAIDIDLCSRESLTLCRTGQLPLSRLLLAVASHEDLQLYLSLCEHEGDHHNRKISCVKRLDRMMLLKIHYELFNENGDLNVSELFLRLIKNKTHWIDDIVCLYSQLLMLSDIWAADVCFQHPLFIKFQPLLVFQLWMYSSSSMNQNNLNIICSVLESCKNDNPVLIQLSETLDWLKFVIEWVDKEVELLIPDINTLLVPARRHSLLHLLKTMTDLSRLNPDSVKNFMQEALIKFRRDDNFEREVAIFDGFCILTTVLRSIFLVSDTAGKKESDFRGCQPSKKLGPIDKIFLKNLKSIKEDINKLQSLDLRLEILENIFSLLFLRSEDLREDVTSDSGAEDDENCKQSHQHSISLSKCCATSSVLPPGKTVSKIFTQSLPYSAFNRNDFMKFNYNSKSSTSLPVPLQRTETSDSVFSLEFNSKSNFLKKSPVIERREGFLCTNQLVNSLLTLVKDSVMDVKKTLQSSEMETSNIESRLNRLSDAVNDGLWRLELLSKISKTDLQIQNDYQSEWIYLASEGSDSETETSCEKPKRQKRSTESVEKSSESGSNTAGLGSSGSSCVKRQKTKKRKISRKSRIPVSFSLINLMLASPVSLATYFLSLKDIASASAVIKRFGLEEEKIAVEINYIISLHNLKKKLVDLHTKPLLGVSGKETTFGIINKAASAGFLTASITKEVEQFLTQTTLPDVGLGSARALVALDLALTLGASKHHSETLLAFAIKQCSTYALNGGMGGECLEKFSIIMNDHLQEERVQNTIPEILRSPLNMLMLNQKSKRQLLHVMWSSISIALSSFSSSIDSCNSSSAIIACSELAQIINNAKFTWKGEFCYKNTENYLHQLCAYVTLMSRITAPHISVGTPFSLLDRSLMDMIQHLMFQCNVDPEDIEQMLQQLGIDLVHYLVQTCARSVPIIQPTKKPDFVILNSVAFHKAEGEVHPSVVVNRLLSSLISVLQSEGTDFDRLEAAVLREKLSIQFVLQQTSQLADIDLTLISNGDEALVFLLNLMNLMWTHALLVLETQGSTTGLLSKSCLVREVTFSCVGYRIGKVGFVSLHHVHSALVRPLLSSGNSSTTWTSESSLSLEPTWDPRILFALTNHHVLSPKLQVLDFINIDNQLEWCLSDYVRKNVVIADSTVIMPSLLQWYLDYTTLTQGPESEDRLDTLSNASKERVTYLSDFLKENPAFKQSDITGKEIQVVDDVGFRICIDYTKPLNVLRCSDIESDLPTEDRISLSSQEMKDSLLKYLTKKSPVVAMIIQKFHLIETAEETVDDSVVYSYLENELNSDRTNTLSCLFNGDQVSAALIAYPDMDFLWKWLDDVILSNSLDRCLDVISALPDVMYHYEPKLSRLKDLLFLRLSSIKADGWRWCQNIKNVQLMAQGVLNNLHLWSTNGALSSLQTLVTQPGLPADKLAAAQKMLSDISVCQKVISIYGGDDWHYVYKSSCWFILEKLLDGKNIDLALSWSQMHGIPSANGDCSDNWQLIALLILRLLEVSAEETAREMLLLVRKDVCIKICDFIISKAELLSSLLVVIKILNGLKDVPAEMKDKYVLLDIGVTLLNEIPETERIWYRPLIRRPDLIVEQMLMCTRLSVLEKLIRSIENKVVNLPNNHPVSRPNLDLLMRRYASKAVSIRVRRQNKPCIRKVQPQPTGKNTFTPPDVPPLKEKWIPDDEVTECMCCQVAVFSMFNRRHHCRRCGRVVCSTCSSKAMKVAGYGNIPVRSCDQCFDYATPKTSKVVVHRELENDGKWLQGLIDEPEWILKVDETHNFLIREEFSYENAPSISLCLSILKLHSLDTVQPKFLVTISESMLSLLRPIMPGVINPELDYALLVQMIRSLVVGAKFCYSGLGLSAGMAKCDQLLGEVDILNLLVQAHYCSLLPSFPLSNQSAIRNLRSNLLDHELWMLALEISTKAGLDYGSVWFAWGKACLRAGYWEEAREKFSHCSLQKKDLQNSGMLSDILQILQREEGSSTLEKRLSKLDVIANGKQQPLKLKDHIDKKLNENVFVECMYYLSRYGSHSQNFDFLLRHGDITQALHYFKKMRIDPEYFVENIYLPCLRTGRVAALQHALLSDDPKLLSWKVELKTICAWCERREMFNTLYQLQMWMGDYVRAAMTGIRFYLFGARSYSDLITHVHCLHTAISNLQLAIKAQQTKPQNQLPADMDIRMRLNKEELNCHLDTLKFQIDITDFFAKLDSYNRMTAPITLFSNDSDKINLAAKILITGPDIQESFQLARRIYETYHLSKHDVICKAAEQLALVNRISNIHELCNIVQDDLVLCDDILLATLKHKPQNPDSLVNRISDISVKIQAYIDCGMLKAAYLLASRHNRLDDIHKILDAAELLNQPLIKKICLKRLNAESVPSSNSSSS